MAESITLQRREQAHNLRSAVCVGEMKREKFGYRDRDMQREHHVKTEEEIGELQLQVKERQGLWATTRNWKRQGKLLP